MSTDEPIEDLPRGIALAWGVAETPQRGPKREMSVEKIVDAAIELADSIGIQAVSMSAVAKSLGYTPMSLYRYVSAKDDLLLLMQEEATGLPPESEGPTTEWRPRLEELFEAQLMIYKTQPWLLNLPISGSPITPNNSAWLEASLEALSSTPLNFDERMAVALFVTGMARWQGTVMAGYQEQARTTGLSDAELAVREFQLYDAVVNEDNFPMLRQAIDAEVFVSEADPFRFGLDRGLDGVAEYIVSVTDRTDTSTGEEDSEEDPSASSSEADIRDDDPEVLSDKKYREAQKSVRQAQKILAEARKRERQTLREAKVRLANKK